MNDTDRILGELQEFKRATLQEIKELKEQVKDLLHFKWKAAGVMGVLMAGIEIAHLVLK